MKNEVNHEYEINLEWEEDRAGKLTAPGISQSIIVATPPEFEGGMEGIMSPEHLLVASVSSCFMTTFLAIAKNSALDFENLKIKAKGVLIKSEGKHLMTKIILYPKLVITDENKKEKALRILQKSDSGCIITNSIQIETELQPEINIKVLSH